MQSNIYLIGPMGAGKTTVGRHLARLRDCEFVDTDHALEQRTGVSVSHIFEIEGEAGFREREARLLAEIATAARDNGNPAGAVIATGGGIVLRAENRRLMRETGAVIYLRATAELLWERLKHCHSRPLLDTADPRRTLTELLAVREPLYAAEADFTFEARSEPAARMAALIDELLAGLLRHAQR